MSVSFLTFNKSHKKTKTSNELIVLETALLNSDCPITA